MDGETTIQSLTSVQVPKSSESKIETKREYNFKPGKSGNPNGRPPESPEVKLLKKTAKQIIAEYKETLAAALPLISPVLIRESLNGDIQHIKELHDRTMGKAEQKTDITTGGEKINPQFIDTSTKVLNLFLGDEGSETITGDTE